ncbi:hypothetical protein DACRYDRAFT_23478 [Dacryopinax primogenitus]|uniref:Uncharacterized protein n=1 Tax=Dacryopinax primogenitus (strain DJM 731) TaxID=1858805 RepID=M5FRT8_DACPD|nr:uncharacterized protein DACRYDRAFT_23478 [Dacryopinax primogenitus]EJT99940.1 hypothetical protein DACRYDRAFT_23478 [Dacryopinax primogenitus]
MFARQVLFFSATAAAVFAQLTITSPSSSIWWISKEAGNLAWTCNTAPSTETTWTVMITNPNTQLLTDELAIIAEQPNYDCSVLYTPTLNAGTGYQIIFVNPINTTEIWASSDVFEIKPQGSAYAVTSLSASGSGTGTPTAGGAAPSGSSGATTSSAEDVRVGFAGFALAALGGIWTLL